MLIPFENLPENSRIFIYQSNKKLFEPVLSEIKNSLETFLNQWVSHGVFLESACLIKYDRFIIIGVNPELQNASGCAIDTLVSFIQELEKKYDIDLLDKMNVTFRQGENIVYKPLLEFKQMAKDKSVTKNTIVFNNLINMAGELKDAWEVPAEDSWHNRFF